MTRNNYLTMLRLGRPYKGFIQDGGYADSVSVAIRFDRPESKPNTPFEKDTVFIRNKQVSVCLLSFPVPAMPATESLHRQLQTISESLLIVQRFDNMDDISTGYRQLEDECIQLINRGTGQEVGFIKQVRKSVYALMTSVRTKLVPYKKEIENPGTDIDAEQESDEHFQVIEKLEHLKKVNDGLQKIIRELDDLANSLHIYELLKDTPYVIENLDESTDTIESHKARNAAILQSIQSSLVLFSSELQRACHSGTEQPEFLSLGEMHQHTSRSHFSNTPFGIESSDRDKRLQILSSRRICIFRIDNRIFVP